MLKGPPVRAGGSSAGGVSLTARSVRLVRETVMQSVPIRPTRYRAQARGYGVFTVRQCPVTGSRFERQIPQPLCQPKNIPANSNCWHVQVVPGRKSPMIPRD